MTKKAFLFLAEGFEEVEAITPADYLRRAGIELVSVSVGAGRTVTGSHKIPVTADALAGDIDAGSADCLIFPGGMPGSVNLARSKELDVFIRDFDRAGKLLTAICAAPVLVLGAKGILNGRRFTCYPGMEAQITCCAEWEAAPVVCDGNVITSRGAGTAGLFALKIIEKLTGADNAQKIKDSVVL